MRGVLKGETILTGHGTAKGGDRKRTGRIEKHLRLHRGGGGRKREPFSETEASEKTAKGAKSCK